MKSKAKVNLFLHIVGKNDDNYHELESMTMFSDDIFDSVEIVQSKKIKINVKGEFSSLIDDNQNNILYKTSLLLKNYHDSLFEIKLTKNIPVSAGIGGGSSDAATLIKLLQNKYHISLSQDQLKNLCMGLGTDVLSCYYNRALYFSGIGENIELIEKVPKLYAVLVNPLIGVSTKEIFSYYHNKNFKAKLFNKPYKFNSTNEVISFISTLENDLQTITFSLVPEVNKIIKVLQSHNNCLLARMSGSGATCFGLYPSKKCAINASSVITKQYKQWWVRPTILS